MSTTSPSDPLSALRRLAQIPAPITGDNLRPTRRTTINLSQGIDVDVDKDLFCLHLELTNYSQEQLHSFLLDLAQRFTSDDPEPIAFECSEPIAEEPIAIIYRAPSSQPKQPTQRIPHDPSNRPTHRRRANQPGRPQHAH